MPSFDDVVSDPDFYELPDNEMAKVLTSVDPDFKGLDPGEQGKVVIGLRDRFSGASADPTVEPTAEPDMKAAHAPVIQEGAMQASHESTGPSRGEVALKESARILQPVYRPALEGAGAVAGSLAGGTAGAVTGPGAVATTVAGGAIGYATGKKVADYIDVKAGLKDEYTPKELWTETAQDVGTGIALEAGGMAAGAALVPILRGGKWIFKKSAEAAQALFTKKGVERSAGKILQAHTSQGTIYAQNAEEAAEIEKQIPGLRFTLAQRTNDPNLIKLQRAHTRGTTAANVEAEQIASNNAALTAHYERAFPGEENVDDLLGALRGTKSEIDDMVSTSKASARNRAEGLGPAEPQEIGESAVEAIGKAKKPVQATLNELESSIPDYPMSFNNTRKTISEVRSNSKMSDDQVSAIEKIEKTIEKMLDERGKSTYTAMGVRRTLNDKIDKAYAEGEKSVGKALTLVRNALEEDLAKLTDLARSGKLGEYKGKPVYTDEVAGELEKASVRSAQLKAAQVPDTDLMFKEIKDKTGMPMMKQYGEDAESFTARLSKDYKRIMGKEPPMKNTGLGSADELDKRVLQLREILNAVEPGKDVASSMKAFNDFASSEYFGRFDKGAVKKALTKGKEASGAATRTEAIPSLFTTASGADDLIRAVGQEKAGGIMKGHYAYEVLEKLTNDNGDIVGQKLNLWLKRNKTTLEKYGLAEEFSKVKNLQRIADDAAKVAGDFEKSAAARALNADPGKAIANAIKGMNTGKAAVELMDMVKGNAAATKGLQRAFADHIIDITETTAKDLAGKSSTSHAAFQKAMKKYQTAMRVLYRGEPQKYAALRSMQKAYEVANRTTKSPLGGGSDSIELATTLVKSAERVVSFSRTATVIKGLLGAFSKHSQKAVDDLLTRALFDPDYAETLYKIAQGKIEPGRIDVEINKKIVSLDAYREKMKGVAGRVAAGLAASTNLDE